MFNVHVPIKFSNLFANVWSHNIINQPKNHKVVVLLSNSLGDCCVRSVFDNISVSARGPLTRRHSSALELETEVNRRFTKVSLVSYSHPPLMIIASASQFHVYLPWGQCPFSIVS